MVDKEDKGYLRLHLQLHDYRKENGYVVNKTDKPNMTPTFRAICTFAVHFFGLSTFFVASLLFMKDISYCVIRRKLDPLDRAKANFKRS